MSPFKCYLFSSSTIRSQDKKHKEKNHQNQAVREVKSSENKPELAVEKLSVSWSWQQLVVKSQY